MSLEAVRMRERERKQRLRAQLETALADCGCCVLEIGCGHGHWLAGFAARYPSVQCLGIDVVGKRIEKALKKQSKQNLNNVFIFKAEAQEFLDCLPEPIQFDLTFVIYPDPWPKKRHHRWRLIQPDFLSQLALRTPSGGRLYFRTDHLAYFEWTVRQIQEQRLWRLEPEEIEWPYEQETFFQKIHPHHFSLSALRC